MKKIAVVGLGLIGGSIFKALLDKGFEVVGISASQAGADNITDDLNALKDCELVFVCSAMNKTLEVLDKLESILSPDTIVTDVCSLKRFVYQKQRPYKFIPSHPMAGTEHSGFENSFKKLFEGAKWGVTPLKETEKADSEKLVAIIKTLGAEPVFCTPEEHDEAVAMISHMPMLVAQALFKATKNNPLAQKLASSGFRDMTRLAMSNTQMAQDMINLNADNIQKAILGLYSSVGGLLEKDYKTQIEEIKQLREKMYVDGKNVL